MWRNIFQRFIAAVVTERLQIITSNKIFNARVQLFGSIGSISSQSTQRDVLTTQLITSTTPSKIFELTKINIRSMNNDHLIKVLSVLYSMRKMFSSKEILGEPAFRDICSKLLMRARYYDAEESLKVVQYLSALGVPTESAVFQSYLQMMRHYINDLNLPQIIFFNFLLQKQSPIKIVLALKKALPLVVENVLQDQLSSCNQWHTVQLYLLAAQTRMRESTLHVIAKHLVDCVEPLTAQNATFVLWALVKLNFWDDHCTMMADRSFVALTSSLDQLDRRVLLHCLRKLNHSQLYNEAFLQSVTKKALTENWDLHEAHNLAEILTFHEYFHPEFLDYYSKLVEDSFSVADKPPTPLQVTIEAFATPSYRPHNWNYVYKTLSQDIFISQLQLTDNLSLLKLAVNFATLGEIPNKVLSAVFEAFTEQETDTEKYQKYGHDLLLLWHMTSESQKMSYSQVGNCILKMNYRNDIHEDSYDLSLRAALVRSLNGSQYVNTKQKTKFGLILDHVIIYDTNGVPVVINDGNINSDVCLEDLTLPANCTKVVILEKDSTDYLKNVELPNGKSVLEDNVIRKFGFLPVPIKLNLWLKFPERERIPYLTRAIKLALESANTSKNCSTCLYL